MKKVTGSGLSKFLFLLITLVASLITISSDANMNKLVLKGRSLYSFSENQFMFLTETYVYKIEKSKLTALEVDALDRSAVNGNAMTVTIPRESVSYLWPNRPYMAAEAKSKKLVEKLAELRRSAVKGRGEFSLEGQSLYSFSEAFALIQVGDMVYQIKKSDLDAKQQDTISAIGSTVYLAIPEKAVKLSWTISPKIVEVRSPASVITCERVKFNKSGFVELTGTLLCSFDEPHVLVQSQGHIFQLRRKEVKNLSGSDLESPGALVKIVAPARAVEFVWSANLDDYKFYQNRKPATTP